MPDAQKRLILRSGLMNILDRMIGERIIYVSAPAGFGKSTTIRQWVNKRNCAKAFVDLDKYDNDLASFCQKICAALCFSQPNNKALAEIASHPAFLSAPEEFTLKAITALSTRKHIVHVVDDLHFLQNEKVLRLLLVLLKRLPDSFQIILISRNDPPPGFSELWIKGSLARITEAQLRYTGDEIEKLYKKHGKVISTGESNEILRFTGGWPIGVGALLLAGGEPAGKNLEYLDEVILSSVWSKWDESKRKFMINTAVARELNPDLCNVLAEVENSESILHGFMREGAFVSKTEDGNFHYQCLFHEMLKRKLQEQGDEYLHALYEKAGQWHLSQRDFYSALDCFVKCECHDGIAQCFALLVDSGQEYFLVDKLISVARVSLIDQTAERSPYIYSILSWAAFNEGRAEDMARYADLYYKNQAKIIKLDPRLLLNEILVRLIDFRFSMNDLVPGSIAVISTLDKRELIDNGVSIGTINQNMPYLHRGTRDLSDCAVGNIEETAAQIRSSVGTLFGGASDMLVECMLAGLYYEQGYLDKAYAHALSANAKIGIETPPESEFFSSAILLSVMDALGDTQRSKRQIDEIHEMIEQKRAYYLSQNYNALVTRRKLANGDMNAARKWLSEQDTSGDEDIAFYRLYTAFTTSRAYITIGDYDSAVRILTKMLALAETYNRPLDMIEVQILLAIAYWKKKRSFQSEALRFLENAVTLACPYGFAQIFVNEGADLAGMLLRLQRSAEQRGGDNSVPVSYIKMLCLKMQESRCSGLTSGQAEPDVKYTEKQKTVMSLLCDGKSYREIAESMNIKLPTLRSHIALIYKKLDVTNQADAVRKIQLLGLRS